MHSISALPPVCSSDSSGATAPSRPTACTSDALQAPGIFEPRRQFECLPPAIVVSPFRVSAFLWVFPVVYLGLIVLLPLSAVFLRAAGMDWRSFVNAVASPRVMAAYRLSFGASFAAGAVNVVFGLIAAWVLMRYPFRGRRIVDSLVDLPFALPTAVAGIALTALYAPNGWIGRWLAPLGMQVAFTRLGVFVALTFIGLPFVVRTLQPVLLELEPEIRGVRRHSRRQPLADRRSGAFAGAGAGPPDRLRPLVRPRPGRIRVGRVHFRQYADARTEIVPLLIMTKLEQ